MRSGAQIIPLRSAESSLLVLPSGKQQTIKAHAIREGLIVRWLPFVDTYRTLCLAPPPTLKAVFDGVRELTLQEGRRGDGKQFLGHGTEDSIEYSLSLLGREQQDEKS